MSHDRSGAFLTLAAVIALALPADAQSVISTHSGVIHFFEGAVYLEDQPLQAHLGKFPTMPQGAELRTAEGRAEVLLTPGVFLRMDQRSAIRLVANDLADTRVELLAGSAIVDSGEPSPETSVTLSYKDWSVHFLQKGVYRIDSNPPRLWVRQGEAEILAGAGGQPVMVAEGMSVPFAGALAPERASVPSGDPLNDWAHGRNESISADNAITAEIDDDPAAHAAFLDQFTYFPLIGVPSLGLGSSGLYSSFATYQPGFNSIYLPGYTYRPFILVQHGLVGRAVVPYTPTVYRPVTILPVGSTIPRTSGGTTQIPRPSTILAPRPGTAPGPRPAPIRIAPPAGVRAGGHR
jgi:hypothetical protein